MDKIVDKNDYVVTSGFGVFLPPLRRGRTNKRVVFSRATLFYLKKSKLYPTYGNRKRS